MLLALECIQNFYAYIILIVLQNVTVADISDIIAGRPEEDALKTLQYISDSFNGSILEEVDVSDNALGSKGVYACKNVLIGKKLERLYICNNGLAGETAELICKILLEGGTAPPLTTLHFFNNMSGDQGAIAVAVIVKACANLQDFRFSGTRSQKNGCLHVAESLATLTTLTRLDLSDNMFKKEAAVVLVQGLAQQSGLVHLNLRDGGLGSE